MADVRNTPETEIAQRWEYAARPLRAVVKATIMSGRGGLLGGDTSRRKWWWVLTLDCGHQMQRDVRYRPLRDGELPIRGGRTNRPAADRLPAPRRARCDDCDQRSESQTFKSVSALIAEEQFGLPNSDRTAALSSARSASSRASSSSMTPDSTTEGGQ